MENRPGFCSTIDDFLGIEGKECCLSGDFNYGTKDDVKRYIISHGGTVSDSVRRTTEVLIVGGKGNAAWAFGNYGTKVAKALDARTNGRFIFIILEEDFFQAMEKGLGQDKASGQAKFLINEYMSDKERIRIVKNMFELLINGINPITEEPITIDECIVDSRISDCMLYVTEILQQLSEDEWIRKPGFKKLFSVTDEQLQSFQYSETPISLSDIARRLSSLRTDPAMYPMSVDRLTKWLIEKKYLERKELDYGKGMNVPTDAGLSVGIGLSTREGTTGNYLVTTYTWDAQHFLIDNLQEILLFSSRQNNL